MKNTVKNLAAAVAAIILALTLVYTGFNAGIEYAYAHTEHNAPDFDVVEFCADAVAAYVETLEREGEWR